MLFTSDTLDIRLQVNPISGKEIFHFEFKGKFTEEISNAACQVWVDHIINQPDEQFEMIWDCSSMRDFDIKARKQWYLCLMKNKTKISKVTVVGASAAVRCAAKLMLFFFKIDLEIKESEDELVAV